MNIYWQYSSCDTFSTKHIEHLQHIYITFHVEKTFSICEYLWLFLQSLTVFGLLHKTDKSFNFSKDAYPNLARRHCLWASGYFPISDALSNCRICLLSPKKICKTLMTIATINGASFSQSVIQIRWLLGPGILSAGADYLTHAPRGRKLNLYGRHWLIFESF